ncbi:BMP family ABC transporter substrate-binding protein [[Eubacterium] cellulosolvens]
MTENVNRRGYIKYAGAGIVVIAVAGAGAYYASRPGPAPTVTKTTAAPTTQIVTKTEVQTTGPAELKIHAAHYGYHDEGAWEPEIYTSTVDAIRESKYGFKLTLSEGVTSESADTVIELAAKDNDIVYATTNVYDSTVRKVAPRFPDVKFILESDPIGKNPKTIFTKDEYPQNVIIVGPGSLEQNYVIGALVGKLLGPKGRIGFLQALDIPSGVHPGAMLRAGAQSIYPDIEADRSIIGDFVNPVKSRDSVKAMVARGVKCVFVNQDDTSGIIEASQQGIYAIADYHDVTHMAPDTIICSSVWHWKPGLLDILNAIGDGKWDDLRNTEWYWELTLANGGLDFGHFGNMVTEEHRDFVSDMVNKITSGELQLEYLDQW